jgi:hypothetical protein
MLEITIGLAVVLVVLAVPRLRSAFLSLLGLVSIIAAGSAVIAVIVWALYEAKPWLTPDEPSYAEKASPPVRVLPNTGNEAAEAELASALASEEAEHFVEDQQELGVEKLRIAALVGRARYILEEDRKFSSLAALNPLPAGVSADFSNIIAFRIPAWRDSELAEREAASIRTWLVSIGLTAEETANISTAKAWGSLYDMWITEKAISTPASPGESQPAVASVPSAPDSSEKPEQEAQSKPEAKPAPVPPTAKKAAPAVAPIARQEPPRREVVPTAPPATVDIPPRRPPPRRPRPSEREVGPFGY